MWFSLPVDSIFYYLCGTSLLKFSLLYANRNIRPKHASQVGRVSGLYVRPVKGLKALDLQKAVCTHLGLKHAEDELYDRHYMITDAKGCFMNQKTHPVLTKIDVSIHGDYLHLDARGVAPLRMPIHPTMDSVISVRFKGVALEVLDCGQEASDWLSNFLGQDGIRLRYAAPGLTKRPVGTGPLTFHKFARETDQIACHSNTGYLLTSESSLADLNGRLATPADMGSFRPTIVVSGGGPYAEDSWSEIYIGDAKFTRLMLCKRCVIINMNPETGEKYSSDALEELRKYRLLVPEFGKTPCFGTYLVLDRPGEVNVGDPVYAIKSPH